MPTEARRFGAGVNVACGAKVHDCKHGPHIVLNEDNTVGMLRLKEAGFRFQLVYLDPPYNTGRMRGARKSFGDRISNEWQRSIIQTIRDARGLLQETGFLAASINQMELFNLKSALDAVFGASCFVGLFPVKIRHRDRQLMINATFHDLFEYLLIYRVSKKTRFFTNQSAISQGKFSFTVRPLGNASHFRTIGGKKVEIYEPGSYEIREGAFGPGSLRRYVIAGKLATANWSGEWYEKHLKGLGNDLLVRVWGLENKGLGYRWFHTGNEKRRSGVYFQSQLVAGRPVLPTNDLDYTEVVPSIYREGGAGCDYKDSKKPERLLSFLMEYCTRPGDLVLDPFAGSGTTLACAVKADRLAVIIEKNADAMALIRRRIENLRMGLDIDATRYTFRVVEGLPLGDPATAGAALASD